VIQNLWRQYDFDESVYGQRVRNFRVDSPGHALLLVLPALGALRPVRKWKPGGIHPRLQWAVIPNVNVTVTNNATGIVSNVTTNASGDYEVPSLRYGIYTVTAKAAGFSDAVAKDITILGRQAVFASTWF